MRNYHPVKSKARETERTLQLTQDEQESIELPSLACMIHILQDLREFQKHLTKTLRGYGGWDK